MSKQLDFQASREVRHAVIQVITEHLRDDSSRSWQGLDFDFTGVVFDGGDFSLAQFTRGMVKFNGATFSGEVDFRSAQFSAEIVDFSGATFSGGISFAAATFSGGSVYFNNAEFSGQVSFAVATFSGAEVSFPGAEFCAGRVDFSSGTFTGGEVSFYGAQFTGAEVDFTDPKEWKVPPLFPWTGTPPPGVKLPGEPGDVPARVSPAGRPGSVVPVDGPADVPGRVSPAGRPGSEVPVDGPTDVPPGPRLELE